MFDINSYRSAKSSDTYHSYQHIVDVSDHDPDPLANCCCICYNPYSFATMDPEAEDPVQLPCGHVFGKTCVFLWAETSNTCPMCRAELDLQNDTDADMLSYKYSNWQGQMDIDGESEAEYFDAQESCADDECEAEYFDAQECRADSRYQSCEEVWLSMAYEEEHKMQGALESSICSFDLGPIHDFDCEGAVHGLEKYASLEQFPPGEPQPALEKYAYPVDLLQDRDSHFDELVKCHEKWMTTSFDDDDDDDGEDEFAVTYFDVFPY